MGDTRTLPAERFRLAAIRSEPGDQSLRTHEGSLRARTPVRPS